MQIRAATTNLLKKSIIIDNEKNRQQILLSINCVCHYVQKTSASLTDLQHFYEQSASVSIDKMQLLSVFKIVFLST